MTIRLAALLSLTIGATTFAADKVPHELTAAKGLPDGVAKEIAVLMHTDGYRVSGPKGAVCAVWFAKSLEVRPKFKPSLNVKYPLTNGQLVGLLEVPEKSEITDFRKQPIKQGVYTLRYGKQPDDGNHIGTSELYDFLLAVPAKDDPDPKNIGTLPALSKISAKASGTSHPAIFSLLPTEKPVAKAVLEYNGEHDHWILNATTSGKADSVDVPLSIRLVVVGVSAG